MTPRERWLATIKRAPVDRIPTDFWGTPEVVQRLMTELGCSAEDDLWRKLGIDRTHGIAPRYIGPDLSGTSMWGIKTRTQVVADGQGTYHEVDYSPLAHMEDPSELDGFPWPSPDWFDYSSIQADLARISEWPVCGGTFEPFYLYCGMRGLERAYLDLAESPDFLEKALEKIFEFHHEYIRRILEAAGKDGGILFCYVAEDLGSQTSLLFSRKTIERFFIPRMRAMIDLAHSYGVLAFHHDDGAIREIIPRLLEIGVDILNPVQWRCTGMERDGLKRDFGGRITFHGGVDNQYTLPFGTPEEVRREVRENIRILGKGGGYVLAPCHNIQPITPVENILAMYEAAGECSIL
jgi:uroporphyrinogen decarboxylase